MPDSVLALVFAALATLTLLLLLLLAAEGLRGLAGRNLTRRSALVRAARQLDRQQATLARELAGYRSLKATPYREAVGATLLPLQQAGSALRSPDRLVFPRLPTTGLVIGHFLARPRDALDIGRTAWLLRRWARTLAHARRQLAGARAGLDGLRSLPARLAEDCAELVGRVGVVLEALATERAAGIAGVAPQEAVAANLANQLGRLGEDLSEPQTVPATAGDTIALALAAAGEDLQRLEADVQTMRGQRETLDNSRSRLDASLAEERQRAVPAVHRPLQSRLLAYAQVCLAEADQDRAAAAFGAAVASIQAAEAWLSAARAATDVADEVAWLADRRGESLAAERVGGLLERAEALQVHLATLLAGAEATGRSTRTWTGIPQLGELTRALDALAAEAQVLQREDAAAARELTDAGTTQLAELRDAWAGLQELLPLAPADRLSRKIRALEEDWAAAAGKSSRLQAFLQDAVVLTQDLRESRSFLRARLEQGATTVRELPELVADAEEAARDWQCLHAELMSLKEGALQVQQLWVNAGVTGSLEETHELLDEMKRMTQEVRAVSGRLSAGTARLHRAANLYLRTLDTAGQASDVDPARRHRLQRLAKTYYDQAHRDENVEDALESIRKAEDCARELAIS